MARPATGSITTIGNGTEKRWRIRYRCGSRRLSETLYKRDGWTLPQVKAALDERMAQIRLGQWTPNTAAPDDNERGGATTFGETASEWWSLHKDQWSDNTKTDYAWRLNAHLLPAFGDMPIAAIDVRATDAFRADCLNESARRRAAIDRGDPLRNEAGTMLRPFSKATINKWLRLLATIMDFAIEGGLIEQNPMRVNPRRRMLRPDKPRQTYIDSAEKVEAVLTAAGSLDAKASTERQNLRRAVIATFLFGGLRIQELCDLRWRDVDLANGMLKVEISKTDAGVRELRLLPMLREELSVFKACSSHTRQQDFIFATASGSRNREDNIRSRVFRPVVEEANRLLEDGGRQPLPEGLTPHSLRRTCVSLLVAVGWDPGAVMDHVGHADEGVTMRIYRKRMKDSKEEREALRRLVEGATTEHFGVAEGLDQASMGESS